MWEQRHVSDLQGFFGVAKDVLPTTAGSGVAYWFRGQSNAEWLLEPSFMRSVKHRRVSPEPATRASSWSARPGTIASSSGAEPVSSVSLTARRYESVAAITSLPSVNETRIPVSTGRDSSREAARATR